MVLSRLLRIYVFFLPLELLLGKPFGIDTIWKPYRVIGILIFIVALIELRFNDVVLDAYDKSYLIIFLTACGLSSIWCIAAVNDWRIASRQGVEVLLPLVIYLCLKFSVHSQGSLRKLMAAFVGGSFVSAVYAIYEVLALGQADRPSGLSGTAPDLAMNAAFALGFVLFSFSTGYKTKWPTVLARGTIAIVLCLAALISGTRSAWMGIGLSVSFVLILMAFTKHHRQTLFTGISLMAILLGGAAAFNGPASQNAATLPSNIQQRLAWNDNLTSGSGRVEIWTRALNVASTYSYVGGGFAGFMQATARRNDEFQNIRPQDIEDGIGSHNVFLEALVDYGPLSLLLFCTCLYEMFRHLGCGVLSGDRELDSCALLCALLCLTVCGMFLDLLGKPQFWIISAFVTLSLRFQVQRETGRLSSETGDISPKATLIREITPFPSPTQGLRLK
jgi:O-Antigen ligase